MKILIFSAIHFLILYSIEIVRIYTYETSITVEAYTTTFSFDYALLPALLAMLILNFVFSLVSAKILILGAGKAEK